MWGGGGRLLSLVSSAHAVPIIYSSRQIPIRLLKKCPLHRVFWRRPVAALLAFEAGPLGKRGFGWPRGRKRARWFFSPFIYSAPTTHRRAHSGAVKCARISFCVCAGVCVSLCLREQFVGGRGVCGVRLMITAVVDLHVSVREKSVRLCARVRACVRAWYVAVGQVTYAWRSRQFDDSRVVKRSHTQKEDTLNGDWCGPSTVLHILILSKPLVHCGSTVSFMELVSCL